MKFAVIDLETTGSRPGSDSILEIGCVVFGDGETREFATLVDPGEPVPFVITKLTGIHDAMLRGAPTFREIAEPLAELLQGCVFVAHNVSFDWNFLKAAMKSVGLGIPAERLCTVRLSRKLFPGHASYSLGLLAADLGIPMERHHRALDDAKAAASILRMAIEQHGLTAIQPLIVGALPEHLIPSGIRSQDVTTLPELPGVLWIQGAKEKVLHVGACSNLRLDAIRLLSQTGRRSPLAKVRSGIAGLDWEVMGNYLFAQIRRAAEVMLHSPPGNTAFRIPGPGGAPLPSMILVFPVEGSGDLDVLRVGSGLLQGWGRVDPELLQSLDLLQEALHPLPSKGLEGVVRQHLSRLPLSGERRIPLR